jgi:uncharacterized phage protein (TIGR01671 family)
MSREIKFRVYANTDDGMKMVYLDAAECDNGLWFSSNEHIDEYDQAIMQFTGLKDKNGKEIYEGDLVTTRFGPRKIYWDDLRSGFVYTQPVMSQTWEGIFFAFNLDGEILGNIYENPELLNSEANDETSVATKSNR